MVGVEATAGTRETTQTMLAEEKRRKHQGIIMPDDNFRMAWDSAQVLVLIFVSINLPIRLGFDWAAELWSVWWWIQLAVDVYFAADIVLNFFFFAFENPEDKELVDDRRSIRRNYIRGWFAIDFISVLPVAYIVQYVESSSTQEASQPKMLKILRAIRIAKLLRLTRLKRILHSNYLIKQWTGSTKLFRAIFTAVVVTHFYCCLWYFIGDRENGWVPKFFPKDALECPHNTSRLECIAIPDGEGLAHRYLYTFQYCSSVFLGSEMFVVIAPDGPIEMLVTIVAQIFSALIFGYIIGAVSMMITQANPLAERVEVKLAELREFLKEQRVPKHLKNDIREYMQVLYTKKNYDVKEVLNSLPPGLSSKLLEAMYSATLMRVPIFMDIPAGALREICLAMKPYAAQPGDYIYREGEIGRGMFVIEKGKVQLSRFSMTIGVLEAPSFFGDASLQPDREYRDTSAMALEQSQLALLTQEDCAEIAKEYPELLDAFEKVTARKKGIEAVRLNRKLQEMAKDLGVHVQSSVMQTVIDSAGEIARRENDPPEDSSVAAVQTIQRFVRGYFARQRVLTKRGIEEGIINENNCSAIIASQVTPHVVKKRQQLALKQLGSGLTELTGDDDGVRVPTRALSRTKSWDKVRHAVKHIFPTSQKTIHVGGLKDGIRHPSALLTRLSRFGHVSAVTVRERNIGNTSAKSQSYALATFVEAESAQRCLDDGDLASEGIVVMQLDWAKALHSMGGMRSTIMAHRQKLQNGGGWANPKTDSMVLGTCAAQIAKMLLETRKDETARSFASDGKSGDGAVDPTRLDPRIDRIEAQLIAQGEQLTAQGEHLRSIEALLKGLAQRPSVVHEVPAPLLSES